MKIKISEVTHENGKLYHNNEEVDILSEPLFKLFDFEDEKLKYIQLKVNNYDSVPNENLLYKYAMIKSLSTLLELDIIEDMTLIAESADAFYVTVAEGIRDLVGLKVGYYNPYKMDFDHTKLTKEENGSYTFNGIECIEPNNRTSNFFRDFLMLYNSENNVIILEEDSVPHISDLKSQFNSHIFIKIKTLDTESEAYDVLEKCFEDYPEGGMIGAVNTYMVTKLFNESNDVAQDVNTIMGQPDMTQGVHHYDNLYLDVIEAKAKKQKEPILLFKELMKTDNVKDKQRGLLRLGFSLIDV